MKSLVESLKHGSRTFQEPLRKVVRIEWIFHPRSDFEVILAEKNHPFQNHPHFKNHPLKNHPFFRESSFIYQIRIHIVILTSTLVTTSSLQLTQFIFILLLLGRLTRNDRISISQSPSLLQFIFIFLLLKRSTWNHIQSELQFELFKYVLFCCASKESIHNSHPLT